MIKLFTFGNFLPKYLFLDFYVDVPERTPLFLLELKYLISMLPQ